MPGATLGAASPLFRPDRVTYSLILAGVGGGRGSSGALGPAGVLQTPGGPRPAGAGWSRVARGTPSPVQVPGKLDAHVLGLGRDSTAPRQPAGCPLCFCSGPRSSRRGSGVPLRATGEGSRANEARGGPGSRGRDACPRRAG